VLDVFLNPLEIGLVILNRVIPEIHLLKLRASFEVIQVVHVLYIIAFAVKDLKVL